MVVALMLGVGDLDPVVAKLITITNGGRCCILEKR